MVDDRIPHDGRLYIHDGTDDFVRFLYTDDDVYVFDVNDGDRTLRLATEEWPNYRDHLVDGGRA